MFGTVVCQVTLVVISTCQIKKRHSTVLYLLYGTVPKQRQLSSSTTTTLPILQPPTTVQQFHNMSKNNNKMNDKNQITLNSSTAAAVTTVRTVTSKGSAGVAQSSHQEMLQTGRTTPTPSSPHNRHRLDRFGFILNMDGNGRLTHPNNHDGKGDFDFHDDHDDDNATTTTLGRTTIRHTVDTNPHLDENNPERIPTFQEFQRTKRRVKKWGTMMGRWHIPEQKTKTKKGRNNNKQKGTTVSSLSSSPLESLSPISSSTSFYNTNVSSNMSSLATPPLSPQQQSSLIRQYHYQQQQQRNIHRRKVITRLRKGVPDHVRGQVWQYLARVPQRMKQHKGLYTKLVQQAIDRHEQATQHFWTIEQEEERARKEQQKQQQKQQQQGANLLSIGSLSSTTSPTSAATTTTTTRTTTSPPPPPLTASMIEGAKSFKTIQDTIERDIHRTYPRHHLFYEADEACEEPSQSPSLVLQQQQQQTNQGGGGDVPSSRLMQARRRSVSVEAAIGTLQQHRHDNEDEMDLEPQPMSPNRQRSFSTPESMSRHGDGGGGAPLSSSVLAGMATSMGDDDPLDDDDHDDDDHDDDVVDDSGGGHHDDDHDVTGFQTVVGGFCGNDEISNMIKELEGVVGGGGDNAEAVPKFSPSQDASEQLQEEQRQEAAQQTIYRSHFHGQELPPRVADAVGGQASL